jgi:hypothetical protein
MSESEDRLTFDVYKFLQERDGRGKLVGRSLGD